MVLNNLPGMIALAVLIKRLGGEVLISQREIDEVAYGRILEGWQDGKALLVYEPLGASAKPV